MFLHREFHNRERDREHLEEKIVQTREIEETISTDRMRIEELLKLAEVWQAITDTVYLTKGK